MNYSRASNNYMSEPALRDGVYHAESGSRTTSMTYPQYNGGPQIPMYYLSELQESTQKISYPQQISETQQRRVSFQQPSQKETIYQPSSNPTFQQQYLQQLKKNGAPQSRLATPRQSTNTVKVVVRVRPPIPEDIKQCYGSEYIDCTTLSEEGKQIILSRQAYEDRVFTFDKVLGQNSTQEEMYLVIGKPVVEDILLGYNGTILAYGQTGTGKTFTIFGPGSWEPELRKKPERPMSYDMNCDWTQDPQGGVIPRAVDQLFQHIRENADRIEFHVTVSFCQIYMETIMDLIDPTKNNLTIREDPKLGIFVDNLTQIEVNDPQEIFQLLKEGAQNRAISATNMNKVSSRSHVILSITVEQKPYESNDASKGEAAVKRGTLTIVDLAGSERVAKSGSEGQRLEEAKKINKSLSALGNCVAALTDENISHVPFRDSKLTRLLTDSLGGNAKTCLVATIGPALWNYDESYSTLTFATRAMSVKNHAVINEVVDFKALSGNLQRKISVIENEKYKLLARNVDLEREIALLRKELKNATVYPEGNMSAFTSSHSVLDIQEASRRIWEEKEKQMMEKFTKILHKVRMDQARQQLLYASNVQTDNEMIVEQLVTSFLAIPQLKQKILSKLVPDFRKLSLSELDELEIRDQQQQQQRQKQLEQQQQYAEQTDLMESTREMIPPLQSANIYIP
jgi:hypothetical protein